MYICIYVYKELCENMMKFFSILYLVKLQAANDFTMYIYLIYMHIYIIH